MLSSDRHHFGFWYNTGHPIVLCVRQINYLSIEYEGGGPHFTGNLRLKSASGHIRKGPPRAKWHQLAIHVPLTPKWSSVLQGILNSLKIYQGRPVMSDQFSWLSFEPHSISLPLRCAVIESINVSMLMLWRQGWSVEKLVKCMGRCPICLHLWPSSTTSVSPPYTGSSCHISSPVPHQYREPKKDCGRSCSF